MKAIDAFVNVSLGSADRPEYLVRVAEDYFKRADEMFRDFTASQVIEIMDRCEVEKSIITIDAQNPDKEAIAFCDRHPDRFALSLYVDATHGMASVRALQTFKRDHPTVLARVVPFMINRRPNEKVYYPIYAKCVELELPISVNTGIPGPPAPGECQHPIHLDEVCLFFPELKVVMAHGADPWWDVAIRLMIKYANLYLMTSAYAPRYLPPQLLHYMNTRGARKILFASDFPVLSIDRCVAEARALDLRPDVRDNYLYHNAARLFFGAQT